MHPLTHAWARDRQTDSDRKNAWIAACRFLSLLPLVLDPNDPETEVWFRPHIMAVMHGIQGEYITGTDSMYVLRSLYQLAQMLVIWNDFSDIEKVLKIVLPTFHPSSPETQRHWLAMHDLHAFVLKRQKRLRDARLVQERIAASYEAIFGTHSILLIRPLFDLGRTLENLGEAETISSIKSRIRVLCPDGLETFANMDSKAGLQHQLIAKALVWAGEPARAANILTYVSAQLKRVHGPSHINSIQCGAELARALTESKSFEEALNIIGETFAVANKVLPLSHRVLRQVEQQMSSTLDRAGYHEEAQMIMRTVVTLSSDPVTASKYLKRLRRIRRRNLRVQHSAGGPAVTVHQTQDDSAARYQLVGRDYGRVNDNLYDREAPPFIYRHVIPSNENGLVVPTRTSGLSYSSARSSAARSSASRTSAEWSSASRSSAGWSSHTASTTDGVNRFMSFAYADVVRTRRESLSPERRTPVIVEQAGRLEPMTPPPAPNIEDFVGPRETRYPQSIHPELYRQRSVATHQAPYTQAFPEDEYWVRVSRDMDYDLGGIGSMHQIGPRKRKRIQ
ncbi:hypothetical protein CAC42_1526 [Sphaceloma murrayae]|uniref:Uncharacterized protein n=1 Tax=Sphaceloma murrayae TaxID=2082308 RepID=A0A2K1R305_9PEZI|nr:hypothetical protein CAC42_1526 [Sphaceloma murrayae]